MFFLVFSNKVFLQIINFLFNLIKKVFSEKFSCPLIWWQKVLFSFEVLVESLMKNRKLVDKLQTRVEWKLLKLTTKTREAHQIFRKLTIIFKIYPKLINWLKTKDFNFNFNTKSPKSKMKFHHPPSSLKFQTYGTKLLKKK